MEGMLVLHYTKKMRQNLHIFRKSFRKPILKSASVNPTPEIRNIGVGIIGNGKVRDGVASSDIIFDLSFVKIRHFRK
jgi:hypothetical protein